MQKATEKIARILRTDRDNIVNIEKRLSSVTGKTGVFEKIAFEKEEKMKDRIARLGLPEEPSARQIYDALIAQVERHDALLCEGLGVKRCTAEGDFGRIVAAVREARNHPTGLFIKWDKARELLRKEPPRKVMEYLGYTFVDDMLEKEELIEILAALRFVEGSEWLNGTFFKQYDALTPDDFEERQIEIRALSDRWNRYAKTFVMKKWHNVSHLKEFGVLFIIPISLGIPGELLRMLNLIFHYTHEIPFYSGMFKRIMAEPETFAKNLQSLLRGDSFDRRPAENGKSQWLVIQRYLAKDDEFDWRLSAPHINPEAIHWRKAEDDLEASAEKFGKFGHELNFWSDLDWVGGYFKDEEGNSNLVSFDLVDTVMELVRRHEQEKFLYHQQEALWNRIFIEYFGPAELEEYCRRFLLRGHFEI